MKATIPLLVCLGVPAALMALCPQAAAADLGNGQRVFQANCAQCHAGGRNLVQTAKSLKKDALEKYGMYSPEAIIQQVTNGKNAMPAFRGRLKPGDIENVAAFVLDQADKGWK